MSNDQRIKNIISSCGGFLAVMPYRDAAENEPYGFTSKYILREVDWALEIGVPVIIIKDDRVILPDKILKSSIHVADISLSDGLKEPKSPIVLAALENMNEHFLRTLISDHYAFFASDINPDNAVRNKAIREIIQRVSAMPCRFGERIHTQGNLYGIIIERIRNSFMMIADITDQRVNIMIEAGIAIGAKVPIYYVQYSEKEEAKHRPPVMLGTIEPSKYKDEVELIGIIHRLAYPYRRRVLNSEIGGR